MAIDKPIELELRALGINNIPRLAPIIADLLLLRLVEVIEPRRQRIVEVLDIARRMQGLPGADTRLSLARLEDEEQRVQASYYLFKGEPEESRWAFLVDV